jgi:hypothetical protein
LIYGGFIIVKLEPLISDRTDQIKSTPPWEFFFTLQRMSFHPPPKKRMFWILKEYIMSSLEWDGSSRFVQYNLTTKASWTPGDNLVLQSSQVGLQMDRIWTDNALIVSISVIIFWIRIVSNMDTNRIFNGYRIQIRYRTDIYTNTDIFQILSKILYISLKK